MRMASGKPRRVSILGSTGSIGTTALELIGRFEDRFRVVGLAAGRRVESLKDQIERFRPEIVSVADAGDAAELERSLGADGPRVLCGAEGLLAVAGASRADIVLSALVGAVGLEPTLAAIDAGIDVGLANKEVMVIAGELVCRRAHASGATVLPVDSEHNAIFQALEGRRREHVRRIVLTASGGPFLGHTAQQLERVTREEALRHPTWDMGDKITIDSATLMNKGLEVVEARWFFEQDPAAIDVVVHPQSIVHSMVEYRDGSVVAVMAIPDMTIPIAHVLVYPDLLDLDYLPRLDLPTASTLEFHEPDRERFPCLRLAFESLEAGGTMPAVANAANEVAVARFLAGEIGFTDIPRIIEAAMHGHTAVPYDDVETLLAVDAWAREHAGSYTGGRAAAGA
ncbi:MAG: 1-deoxy-D-xylulose-5-phosphate reductoisomerase [Candidatus Binatia bacterium]